MPRGHSGGLRPHRDGDLGDDQHDDGRQSSRLGKQERPDPPDLTARHPSGETQCRPPPTGVRPCGTQPQHGQGRAQYGVSQRDDAQVAFPERPGYAGGENERPRDLDQHHQPVGDVVRVVGRGEPREVHPRPPDGEEHQSEAQQAGDVLPVDHRCAQARGRLRHRYDDAQVEEEFQRGGGPVRFAGVTTRHAAPGSPPPSPGLAHAPGREGAQCGAPGSASTARWKARRSVRYDRYDVSAPRGTGGVTFASTPPPWEDAGPAPASGFPAQVVSLATHTQYGDSPPTTSVPICAAHVPAPGGPPGTHPPPRATPRTTTSARSLTLMPLLAARRLTPSARG